MIKNAVFVLLLLPLFVMAETYKWTDSKGHVHYSDTAPKHKAEKLGSGPEREKKLIPSPSQESEKAKARSKKRSESSSPNFDQTKS